MNLRTEAQLAADFGLPVEKVAELRRKRSWPHVRLSRFDVRYTDEQIAEIVERHSQRPKAGATAPAKVTGQTSRSANRRRSA